MKERLLKYGLKYGPYVGYPAFFLFCLLLFSALLFPYDKLRERVVATFNADQHGPGAQELEIDELHGSWITGVHASGVRLLTASSEPGKPPGKLEIDDVTLRYSLLSGLVGSTYVSFDLFGVGGEVSGHFETGGKDKTFEAKLDSVQLGEVGPLRGLLGVPLSGKLDGEVRLVMAEGKASKANGSVTLEAKDASVGDGKSQIKGLALPKLDVGTITLAAEAKDGVLKFTKFVAGGKDVELQGDGRVQLRDVPLDSICDVQVRFKVNDSYRTKSDTTKALFGEPGSSMPGLMDLDPHVKQSKRADGFYAWNMRGALGRLDFSPAGGSGGGGIASPGRTTP